MKYDPCKEVFVLDDQFRTHILKYVEEIRSGIRSGEIGTMKTRSKKKRKDCVDPGAAAVVAPEDKLKHEDIHEGLLVEARTNDFSTVWKAAKIQRIDNSAKLYYIVWSGDGDSAETGISISNLKRAACHRSRKRSRLVESEEYVS